MSPWSAATSHSRLLIQNGVRSLPQVVLISSRRSWPSIPNVGASALAVLLDQARKKTIRVWAEQSPFDLKDVLKRRGYRWCDGSDGRPRSWYIDVGEDQLGNEIAFLKTEIYLSEVEPRLQTLTALSRFSVRA